MIFHGVSANRLLQVNPSISSGIFSGFFFPQVMSMVFPSPVLVVLYWSIKKRRGKKPF